MKRLVQIALGCVQLLLSALAISALWWTVFDTPWRWLLPRFSLAETLIAFVAVVVAVYCGLNGRRLLGLTHLSAHPAGHVPGVSYLLTALLALIVVSGVIAERTSPANAQLASRFQRAIRPQRIFGSVSDAKTGGAIVGLRITAGSPFADYYSWSSDQGGAVRGTHFETVFHRPLTQVTSSTLVLSNIVLRFSAPGYETVVSSPFRQHSGSDSFDVRMQQATMSAGRVLAPDGTPVAHATVLILSKATGARVSLQGTKVSGWQGEHIDTTDAGGFQLACPGGDFRLLVADPRGFGVANADSSNADLTIMLQPWARLEGQWHAQGRPNNVRALSIAIEHLSGVSVWTPLEYSAADGRFVLPHLPPGTFSISWQAIPAPDAPRGGLELTNGEASPGQTVQLDCATIFRTVTGRLPREGSSGRVSFAQTGIVLNPVQDTPPPKPDDLDTPEKNKAWWAAWGRTEAGRAFATVSRSRRQIEVQPDGRFACAYVVPGKYWIHGWWDEGNRTRASTQSRQIEIGPGDGPLDIGELVWEPERVAYLQKGARAPVFDVPGVAGARVSLGSRPGKFVLVDFWATSCFPCLDEIKNLRTVFEKYGAGDRLVVLSLDMDADVERAQRYIEANGMTWPQGFLQGGWQNAVAIDYGVNAIPAIFLVGPDGRVVDRDMRGSGIEAAVSLALSR